MAISSSKKMKFLCSYGGKILPRPSDGALRYVGGHTRIISLKKNASFRQVMLKMEEVFGSPAVLKYQLPGEDLDALVSVSFSEDLESMIEEYDKLMEVFPDGSVKLRIFLFPQGENDVPVADLASDFEQNFVELVNKVDSKETLINRKESSGSDELFENTNEGSSFSTSIPTTSSSLESPGSSMNPYFYPQVPPFPSSLLPSGRILKSEELGVGIEDVVVNNLNHSETGACEATEKPPDVEALELRLPKPWDEDGIRSSNNIQHSLSSLHYPLREDLVSRNTDLSEACTTNDLRMLGFDSQVGNYFPFQGICMSVGDLNSEVKGEGELFSSTMKSQEKYGPESEEIDMLLDNDKMLDLEQGLSNPNCEDSNADLLGEILVKTHDGAGSEECIYLQGFLKNTCTNAVHQVEGTDEELVKLELQAIAEDVASSVLKQSTPDDDSLSTSNYSSHRKDEVFDFQALEGISYLQTIKNRDIEELEELGSGTFGTVYHGKWRGSDVAIKRIHNVCFSGKKSEQERMRVDFWNEARKLAVLHHPNVVAFYGVVLDGPGGSVATVTEFMVNGSLRQALQKSHKTLDRRKRLIVATDVACGMEYLHGRNIVHFDLKSDNLLVNLRDPQRPICKVGDLGLSKVKRKTLISGGVRGTLPWMAPELLNGSSSLVSEKVDVFSFAIVMWELLTGQEPYADLHYGAIIGGIVNDTLRPPVPEVCDPSWRSLMERCWSSEPSLRPSFAQISRDLRAMAGPAGGNN